MIIAGAAVLPMDPPPPCSDQCFPRLGGLSRHRIPPLMASGHAATVRARSRSALWVKAPCPGGGAISKGRRDGRWQARWWGRWWELSGGSALGYNDGLIGVWPHSLGVWTWFREAQGEVPACWLAIAMLLTTLFFLEALPMRYPNCKSILMLGAT